MFRYLPRALGLVVIAVIGLGACAPATGTPEALVATPTLAATPGVNSTPQAALPGATPVAPQPATAAPIKSKDPTTFTYLTLKGPDTLDTAFNYQQGGGMVIQNTYDTLIFYNREHADQFAPQLATDVPSQANGGISPDGKTYTFKIRSGVKFHNGDTLTPDNVAFTFQRGLLQGGLSSPQWMLFQPILGLAASPSGNNDITDLVDPSGKLGDDRADLIKADPAKLLAACQTVSKAILADDAAGTVTFHLAQPWGPFLATLANTWGSVVDKKWIGANGGWDGACQDWQNFYQSSGDDLNKLAIGIKENGTGPYVLDHWTPNQEVVLKAFDGYWRTTPAWPGGPAGVPRLKTIRIDFGLPQVQFAAQLAARLSALRAGDADTIDLNSSADWPQLDALVGQTCDAAGACATVANPANPVRVFTGLQAANRTDVLFNFKIDTAGGNDFIGSGQLDGNGIPPDFFSDLHVRKAFNYCFDWSAYINGTLQGDAVQSYDVMLPGEIGYGDQDPHYYYDPEKCKAEFQAASLKSPDGKSLWDTGFRVTALYNSGNTIKQTIAQILSRDLSAVNPKFVVSVVSLPWPTYLAAQQAHKLPLWVVGWLEDIHDPHNWLVAYATEPFGASQSLAPDLMQTLSALISQGAQETDPARRAAIYKQFNQAFYEAAPDILLAVQGGRFYEQRWVHGYYYNPIYSGYYFYALSK